LDVQRQKYGTHAQGKSTHLDRHALVVNHTNDKRPGVQNHDGQRLEAIKTTELLLVGTGQYNVVAGLNGDFQRQKFGEILDLVPYADDVTFKRALCARCRHPSRQASFTKRLDDARDVVSVDSTHIAVCRQCWEKLFLSNIFTC
jgi:hypothetical protein